MKRKSVVKEALMKARHRRGMRLKSKRGPNKRHKAQRRVLSKNDDVRQFEPAHSLLLSSLKFWEVERDLIEERLATTGR